MTQRVDRYERGAGQPALAFLSRRLPATPTVRPWRSAVNLYLAAAVARDFLLAGAVVGALTRDAHDAGVVAVLVVAAGLGFVVTIAVCQGYGASCTASNVAEFQSLLRATGVLAVASLAVHYTGVLEVPRSTFFEALAITVVLAATVRWVGRRVVRRMRDRGVFVRRTLVVGPVGSLNHLFDVLDDAQSHGLVVVGVCTPTEAGGAVTPKPVLGRYDAIPRLARELHVDAVLVSADALSAEDLRRLGWQLADLPTDLLVLPSITEVAPRRLHLESLGGTPVLGITLRPARPMVWSKTLFDRGVGLLLLLLSLLVIAPAAGMVRLTSPGPAFFAQRRIGLAGQPFTMYKLRSMYTDAEQRLADLIASNDGNGMLFKMHDDPRVTPLGRLLRRLSIDELPQLWNVIRGEMSLVGPRPALPSEVAAFDDDVRHRLHVKPGLTGLWQVSGRSNLSAEQSVRLDLRYTDNWSMRMDVHILWRTARAVLSGNGAY